MTVRWGVVFLLPLAGLTFVVLPALAFDGKRKGFVLGFGLGAGYSFYSQEWTEARYPYRIDSTGTPILVGDSLARLTDSGSSGALSTDFRIGWGFTERFLLFYDNQVNWFGDGGGGWIADGLTSIGFSYYLSEARPSMYLTGGGGYAGWGRLYQSGGSSGYNGLGFFAGVGYEMGRVLSMESTISYGMPKDEESFSDRSTTSLALRARIMALWH